MKSKKTTKPANKQLSITSTFGYNKTLSGDDFIVFTKDFKFRKLVLLVSIDLDIDDIPKIKLGILDYRGSTLQEVENDIIKETDNWGYFDIDDVESAFLVCDKQIHFDLSQSTISCGILELEGIDDVGNLLKDKKLLTYISKTELEKVLITVMDTLLTELRKRCAFVIMSTTTNASNKANLIMNKLNATQSPIKRNPNSKNNIKIWIY